MDRMGRVFVNDDLSIPGHPEVFVVGDLAVLVSAASRCRASRRRRCRAVGRRPRTCCGRSAARGVELSLFQQGRPGDDRAVSGRGGDGGPPFERRLGLVGLAVHPHHVSRRLSQPNERARRMGIFVLHLSAWRADDHRGSAPAPRISRHRARGAESAAGHRHGCCRASVEAVFLAVTQPPPSNGIDFARIGISGVRLEALFEAVPLAIAVFDGELRLANANAQYRELTGVSDPLPATLSIYDAFPNALADLTDQIDTALRGGTPVPLRVPFQHRSTRRLIETTFATLVDENGGRGILFAGNDVSEREELRETLSRNVAQLESIFDVIPDSVRVSDTEGRTVRSNTQALQDHPAGQPSTLRELWQLDRPRTIERHEPVHARAPDRSRAPRRARTRRDARRAPRRRRAAGDHRGELESVVRRARQDPRRGHRRARRHDQNPPRQRARGRGAPHRRALRARVDGSGTSRAHGAGTHRRAARVTRGARARKTTRRGRPARRRRDARREQRAQPDHGGGVSARDERRESRGRARLCGTHRESGGNGRGHGGARRTVHSPGAAASRARRTGGSLGDVRRSRGDDAAALGRARARRRDPPRPRPRAGSDRARHPGRDARGAPQPRAERARRDGGRRNARPAHDRRRRRGAPGSARHGRRHVGRSARAGVRAVLLDEGQCRARASAWRKFMES